MKFYIRVALNAKDYQSVVKLCCVIRRRTRHHRLRDFWKSQPLNCWRLRTTTLQWCYLVPHHLTSNRQFHINAFHCCQSLMNSSCTLPSFSTRSAWPRCHWPAGDFEPYVANWSTGVELSFNSGNDSRHHRITVVMMMVAGMLSLGLLVDRYVQLFHILFCKDEHDFFPLEVEGCWSLGYMWWKWNPNFSTFYHWWSTESCG